MLPSPVSWLVLEILLLTFIPPSNVLLFYYVKLELQIEIMYVIYNPISQEAAEELQDLRRATRQSINEVLQAEQQWQLNEVNICLWSHIY